jgi:hypothetical protein
MHDEFETCYQTLFSGLMSNTAETHLRNPMVLSSRGAKSIVSIWEIYGMGDPNIRCLDLLLAGCLTQIMVH